MKRGTEINGFLRPLADNPYQCYLTNELQVADLLEWILEQFGPSYVWQTTFSISEEFLRRLFFIKKEHSVLEFKLILDFKATNKTISLWPFICQVIDRAYLANNHSKVLLVRSAKGEVATVVTSQNLTRGNRLESAFVSSDLQNFYTMRNAMEQIIKDKSIPLHELFRQRVETD